MPSCQFVTLLAALVLAVPGLAAEPTEVDRKILRQPAYQSQPKYCLLMFGPQAHSVWLVQDGDTLYVDRNGNGDLTEPGEAVKAKPGDITDAEEGVFHFEAGDVRDGNLTHKNLYVMVLKVQPAEYRSQEVKDYFARHKSFHVGVDVEVPGRKGAGIGGRVAHHASSDASGYLHFSDQPTDAPLIHFGGRWQVMLYSKQQLTIGRETDLILGVGTPGLGPGATAFVGYEGIIPEEMAPTAEITYPSAGEGEPPVRERYELKHRC